MNAIVSVVVLTLCKHRQKSAVKTEFSMTQSLSVGLIEKYFIVLYLSCRLQFAIQLENE